MNEVVNWFAHARLETDRITRIQLAKLGSKFCSSGPASRAY